MKNKKDYKNHKGFTLVELIVVIVILAILAAILIPGLLKWIDQAKQKQCELEARSIYLATEASLAELYAWGFDGTKDGKPIDVTELQESYIMNYLPGYNNEWLKYIREKSGIEKVDFIKCYINNGKVEAVLIRYVSSTNSENYILASIRGADAEYYENYIKDKWLAAPGWGFGEWDWADTGTWVIKEGPPLELKDR